MDDASGVDGAAFGFRAELLSRREDGGGVFGLNGGDFSGSVGSGGEEDGGEEGVGELHGVDVDLE